MKTNRVEVLKFMSNNSIWLLLPYDGTEAHFFETRQSARQWRKQYKHLFWPPTKWTQELN
jgi:hypothetical protein